MWHEIDSDACVCNEPGNSRLCRAGQGAGPRIARRRTCRGRRFRHRAASHRARFGRPGGLHCEHPAHVRRKKGWSLGTIQVSIELQEEGEVQRIERRIAFSSALPPTQRRRLAEISDKTPVTRMLKGGIAIRTILS